MTRWWRDLAVEVYQKRYGEDMSTEDYEEWAKRANFLQRRGFTVDQIQYALKRKS
jgi:SOS response regulatory protein OraA/RecX